MKTRRDLLKFGGLALTAASLAPRSARGQQPRRGGTVTVRAWDPPHFDPHLTIAYKTLVPTSFTHSRTTFFEPHNELFGKYAPGEPKNQSHVNDPVVTDLLDRQRRTLDSAKRRELIHDLRRHVARQQYYVELPSEKAIAVWDGALRNYGPNYGNDYGGRRVAAWLDR